MHVTSGSQWQQHQHLETDPLMNEFSVATGDSENTKLRIENPVDHEKHFNVKDLISYSFPSTVVYVCMLFCPHLSRARSIVACIDFVSHAHRDCAKTNTMAREATA